MGALQVVNVNTPSLGVESAEYETGTTLCHCSRSKNRKELQLAFQQPAAASPKKQPLAASTKSARSGVPGSDYDLAVRRELVRCVTKTLRPKPEQ